MRYNTNNPVGTDGSSDPRDAYDNLANLDVAMTSDAMTFMDRKGVTRVTYKGFEVKAESAMGEANRAAAQAAKAEQEAVRSELNADRAEVFSEAARTLADLYTNVEAGVASVLEGDFFQVPSSESGEFTILYKKISGEAVEYKRTPSSEKINELESRVSVVDTAILPEYSLSQEFVWAVIDQLNRVALGLRPDGTLQAKFKELDFDDAGIQAGFETIDEDIFAIVDQNNRVALRIKGDGTIVGKFPSSGGDTQEVIDARGSRTTLNQRLSQSLNNYGMPKQFYWGSWFLRETRQRLRKRLLGESTTLTVAAIGDSWTHSNTRWNLPTSATLKSKYGDAGAGYVSFARFGTTLPNGNVLSNAAVTYTGTWDTSAYNTNYSPDLGSAKSSVAGSLLQYTIPADPSSLTLFCRGSVGAVRYRHAGGAWVDLDLTTYPNELAVIDLTSPVAGVFEIEVVSGTPELFGIDVKKSASGVRWHKLGATGSRASQWVGVNEAQWGAGLAALAPNLVTILHGTNDQSAYDPATYKTNIKNLVNRVKAALPLADILLIAPCENGRANTHPMSGYASALYEIAVETNCAYMDLQYVFGEAFSQYSSTSPRNWFNADLIHPEPNTGGRAIADAAIRMIEQY